MSLLLIAPLTAYRWYLSLVLARIERTAPMHPERVRTERELLAVDRRIAALHRRITL